MDRKLSYCGRTQLVPDTLLDFVKARLAAAQDDRTPPLDQSLAPRQLRLNGEALATAARSLADLLLETGYGDAKVATAVNGTFVPARARASHTLAEGDHIEVVAARQGG